MKFSEYLTEVRKSLNKDIDKEVARQAIVLAKNNNFDVESGSTATKIHLPKNDGYIGLIKKASGDYSATHVHPRRKNNHLTGEQLINIIKVKIRKKGEN